MPVVVEANVSSTLEVIGAMKRQLPEKDTLRRMREAEGAKDWNEVVHILDEATESDANAIEPVIPELITHRNYVIRASAVEMVGAFRQKEFVNLVKARLRDPNKDVTGYALEAYYDLLGDESLPTLKDFCEAKSVGVRVTALALCYVATGDREFLWTLKKILLRPRCDYRHRYAALNILDHYLDVSSDLDVIEMFRSILEMSPKSQGIVKDIKKKLKEWGAMG
jgi:hypothetical protein